MRLLASAFKGPLNLVLLDRIAGIRSKHVHNVPSLARTMPFGRLRRSFVGSVLGVKYYQPTNQLPGAAPSKCIPQHSSTAYPNTMLPYLGQIRVEKFVAWTRSMNIGHFSPISSTTFRRLKPTRLSLLASFLQ
jgi:hypothetical protein